MTGYPPEKTRTAADELYVKADRTEALAEAHRRNAASAKQNILDVITEPERAAVERWLEDVEAHAFLVGIYSSGAERYRGQARREKEE